MKKILLAEDNDNLRELSADFLIANGYEVTACEDGLMAWEAVQENRYDLIFLDVMMPEMDGFELCKKIREIESVPIIFLTAKVAEEDQLHGFNIGADDYIIKPFSLPVLLAKVKVILERNNHVGEWIVAGVIKMQPIEKKVLVAEREISLTSLDFDLLLYFIQNSKRVLTREQILIKVWGYDYEGTDRSVDTHVKSLRKALGEYGKAIRTVVKTGYVFDI